MIRNVSDVLKKISSLETVVIIVVDYTASKSLGLELALVKTEKKKCLHECICVLGKL